MTGRTMIQAGLLCLALVVLAGNASAEDPKHWIMSLVDGNNFAGASKIETQVIEECIQSLPQLSDLEAVVDAKSVYMKNINGDLKANHSVRTFNASVVVPYTVRRKVLLVVTTASIEGSEPTIQEVEGRFDESVAFRSNPENGDQFSGRELVLDYYFSKRELAAEDALRRASAWLKLQSSVMCGK